MFESESENKPTSISSPVFNDFEPQLQKMNEMAIIITITMIQPILYILNLQHFKFGNSEPIVVAVFDVYSDLLSDPPFSAGT